MRFPCVCWVLLADPSFLLRHLLHDLGEMGDLPFQHDGVEVAGDLIVALTSDCFPNTWIQSHLGAIQKSCSRVLCACGIFLADPSFHLLHLLLGLGEMRFPIKAVKCGIRSGQHMRDERKL